MYIEDIDRVANVKQQNLNYLLKQKNVVGVGVGLKESQGVVTDEVAVTVNVVKKIPKAQLTESDEVPRNIDGVKTDVVETGRFLAGLTTTENQNTKDRWRPTIPPGVSIGHIDITAGTFGCLVRRGSEVFILSNNHVLANVNMGRPGDPIIQPGRYDGGTIADQVATLAEYIPIDFGGTNSECNIASGIAEALSFIAKTTGSQHRVAAYRESAGENLIDAALARPLDPKQVIPVIHKIGRPKGIRIATLGTQLQKTGRTTDHTTGFINQVDVTTTVDYNGRSATFTNQFMASGMSAGGDSGSAVLDDEGYVVGLLYAGSGIATLINPIKTVLDLLDVEIMA